MGGGDALGEQADCVFAGGLETLGSVAVTEELLRQEVEELTDLLRNDAVFAGLRDLLTDRGLLPSETLLAGFIESEDESMYGVFVTFDLHCIRFETSPDGGLAEWRSMDDLSMVTEDFEAVAVAVAMRRAGEIR